MENGPSPKKEIYTNFKRFNLLLDAIDRYDEETVKNLANHDGLKIKHQGMNIATYCASINNFDGCELLTECGAKPIDICMGFVIGNHVQSLVEYMLFIDTKGGKHFFNQEQAFGLLIFAKKLQRKELLEYVSLKMGEGQNNDWVFGLETISLLYPAPSNDTYYLDIIDNLEKKSNLDNIDKYFLAKAAAQRGNLALTLQMISQAIIKPYPKLVNAAAAYGHFDLANELIEMGTREQFNILELYDSAIEGAIEYGKFEAVLIYINKAKLIDVDYNRLANRAAFYGDYEMADELLSFIPLASRNYQALAAAARQRDFNYAAKHLEKLHLKTQKSLLEIKQMEEQAKKEEAKKVALEEKESISQLLTFDLEIQQKLKDQHKELLLQYETINNLLDELYSYFNNEKLLSLEMYKGSLFINEKQKAYDRIKSLVEQQPWLDRTSFSLTRAKLRAYNQNTKISLKTFFDFINACRATLIELKNEKPLLPPSDEKNPSSTTTAPLKPTPNKSSGEKLEGLKKTATINSKLTVKPPEKKQQSSQKSRQQRKQKPKQHNSVTSTEKIQNTAPKASSSTKPTSSTTATTLPPLPPKGPLVSLPNREPKTNFESMVRKHDTQAEKAKTAAGDTKLDSLKMLLSSRVHLAKESATALNTSIDTFEICDLAMLDLIFKINRSLFLDKNDQIKAKDIYDFDCTLIHGINHYLMSTKGHQHTNLHLFVTYLFDFSNEDPIIKYLNPITRASHGFYTTLADSTKTSSTERLKLIKRLLSLQDVCFKLTQENNDHLKLLGRHALSAVIIILGEQYARLDDNIQSQIYNKPLGKVLNSYRQYRNLRHGNTEQSRSVHLDDLELDIVFKMEREDWEFSLTKLVSKFKLNNQSVMGEQHDNLLNKLIGDLDSSQQSSERDLASMSTNGYLPNYNNQISSSQSGPTISEIDEQFKKLRLSQ